MRVKAIRTEKFVPPKHDLFEVLEKNIESFEEESILVVTSKVVAIHQGRCIPLIEGGVDRDVLAQKEADLYAPRDIVPGQHLLFTLKRNVLIASAGIDKSNADGYMILWPNDLDEVVKKIWSFLRKKFGVSKVGVIITDSHVVMMRRGTMGISLSHYGFNPVRDYVGSEDIFGRELQVQVANVVDSLATAAVIEMGEGKEQTPLTIIDDLSGIEFTEDENKMKGDPLLSIPMDEDLYEPMLSAVPWKKGGGGMNDKEIEELIARKGKE